ncbi:hypothetical protein [Catalinimonas niigatensis]|uniref:hypothetical protein n=1 Tax=Catalinimonas niigatensis TaxID=1397264 RepID=UPI0026663C5F|nr:hypothetical protein [Catalinimonas niigatensis]WPP51590.1 hypothetical protein PZB72_04215 [Catalinimonas niigatensis]
MMAIIHSLLLLICLWICPFSIAFSQELDLIKYKLWDIKDTLQWSDYTFSDLNQDLEYGFQAKAVTSLAHIYVPGVWHVDSCMNVLVAFRKRYSFTGDTTHADLLAHESIHFDIAEVFARYLRKELLNLSESSNNNLDEYLTLRNRYFKEATNYQDLYDQETVYGLNTKEQRRWASHIKAELKIWEDYSFENTLLQCNSLVNNK